VQNNDLYIQKIKICSSNNLAEIEFTKVSKLYLFFLYIYKKGMNKKLTIYFFFKKKNKILITIKIHKKYY